MRISRATRDTVSAIGFLAPNFAGFAVFSAWPVLFSLIVSFSNWNLQGTVPFAWTGFENYTALWHDRKFWLFLINTGYLMLGMPVAIAASLVLAVMLSQRIRGVVAYRTVFFLPTFTSGVALMILWKALYNPDFGPINLVIERVAAWFGFAEFVAPKWLISTANLLGLEVERVRMAWREWGLGARDAIIIMGVWSAVGGTNMLLYIAALANVPQELYEAAEIDGAGKWAQFRNVTWPQLAPTTFFIVVMSFIGGLQGGFEQARVLTEGGPAQTTTTLSYYIYTKAFLEFEIGYASAVSWVLFGLIFGVTLVNWKFGSRAMND